MYKFKNLRLSEKYKIQNDKNKFTLFVCKVFKNIEIILFIIYLCMYIFKLFLNGIEEYVFSLGK